MANEENNHGFTDAELEGLSDEEREALLDEEVVPGDEAEPDNTDSDEDLEHEDPDSEAVSDDITESDDKGPEPEPEQEEAEEEPAQEQEQEQQANPIDEHRSAIEDADAELAELDQQLEDGEVSFSEYRKLQNEINSRKLAAQSEINKAEARQEVQQELRKQQFSEARDRFLAEPGHDVVMKNPVIASAMQTAMQEVAASNEAKGKSYDWLFAQAKQRLTDAGISIGESKPTDPPKQREKEKGEGRKPRGGKEQIPQTLADAPAATANGSDEFSHLDDLEGVEFEEALSKMSVAQQEKYLNRG